MREVVFMTLPRECFVLYFKTVGHRSGKSRDEENSRLVTRSHIFVFSVVACVLLHACCFVSHPSLRTAQGGIILILDVVSENNPSWHGLCLSRMVIASPRYCCCVDCLYCDLDTCYFMIHYLKLETGDLGDLISMFPPRFRLSKRRQFSSCFLVFSFLCFQ